MPWVTAGRFLKNPGVRVQPLGMVVLELLLVELTEVLDTDVLDAEVLLTDVLGVVDDDDVGIPPPKALGVSPRTATMLTNTETLIYALPFLC